MKHRVNEILPKGTYRIICTKCHWIYEQSQGDFTEAALAADGFSDQCQQCLGEVIIETNPLDVNPTYDKEHPYPQSLNQ